MWDSELLIPGLTSQPLQIQQQALGSVVLPQKVRWRAIGIHLISISGLYIQLTSLYTYTKARTHREIKLITSHYVFLTNSHQIKNVLDYRQIVWGLCAANFLPLLLWSLDQLGIFCILTFHWELVDRSQGHSQGPLSFPVCLKWKQAILHHSPLSPCPSPASSA